MREAEQVSVYFVLWEEINKLAGKQKSKSSDGGQGGGVHDWAVGRLQRWGELGNGKAAELGWEEAKDKRLNEICAHCMHVWKHHTEFYLFVQLIRVNDAEWDLFSNVRTNSLLLLVLFKEARSPSSYLPMDHSSKGLITLEKKQSDDWGRQSTKTWRPDDVMKQPLPWGRGTVSMVDTSIWPASLWGLGCLGVDS